eukprot:CAMPEP_0195514054 /NCGR_PEP_ID=MMETSP0794_2-20130614/5566_1 /TAXON_ID=515487 /ORGANISM="Stephanopyxis turris, Strain CCMP 815" /LENGTH=550 /DNA_ID=CAMNT_0040642219 /DNA_START=202 /DNA_END=1854 /DNA_ORIENTATION=-
MSLTKDKKRWEGSNLMANKLLLIVLLAALPLLAIVFLRNKGFDTAACFNAPSYSDSSDLILPKFNKTNPSATLSIIAEPLHEIIGQKYSKTTKIGIKISAQHNDAKVPVDVVVALDVSDSMDGHKLDLAKKTLQKVISTLGEEDSFGLITFSTQSRVVVPSKKLTTENKNNALRIVQNIEPMGMTNIAGGLKISIQEIDRIPEPNDVRAIFLLTDGLHNIGMHEDSIPDMISREFENSEGIGPVPRLLTFGYGANHNENLLREISMTSIGGLYYFLDSDSDIVSAFGDAMGGILSVVAQDTVATISIPEAAANIGVQVKGVYHYSYKVEEDGSVKVKVGDFYSGEVRDVLFEMNLAEGLKVNQPFPHAIINIEFQDTIKESPARIISPAVVSIARPPGSKVSSPNGHVSLQWLRIRIVDTIAKAHKFADEGDVKRAEKAIRHELENLEAETLRMNLGRKPMAIQLIGNLKSILDKLQDELEYGTMESAYMLHAHQEHSEQRSSMYFERDLYSGGAYTTARKQDMVDKFEGSLKTINTEDDHIDVDESHEL